MHPHDAGLLSVAVHRSPTTGGVYASYGSLCDLRVAKAGATISHWLVGGRPGESDALLGELTARGWSSPRVGEPLTDDFADLLRYLRVR